MSLNHSTNVGEKWTKLLYMLTNKY